MSKGLADLQQTIQSYQNSSDAINSYVGSYDKDFFNNWKAKVDLAKDKLESARKLGDEVGEAYLAGKAVKLGYNKIKEKYFNNKNKSDGDEDGNGEQPDGEPDSGSNPAGNSGDNIEPEGDVDGIDGNVPSQAPTEDVGGESGYELQDMNTSAQPSQIESDGSPAESSFNEQGVSEVPQPSGQATLRQAPPDDTSPEQIGEPRNVATQQEAFDEDPEANVGGLGAEAGTQEASLADTVASGASDLAGGATATTEAVSGATSAVTTATTEAGAGIGEAVLGTLGVVGEAVPVLGLLSGIGIGLYELFHHPSKPPKPPVLATASTKGEMVMPTYDSVTDTPASASAF